MARRETVTIGIKCKACGTSGQTTIEENENPVYGRGLDREVQSVSGPFTISKNREMITCDACGKEAT